MATHTALTLITSDGSKHQVDITESFLRDYGYTDTDRDQFKVGDLREYIFDAWETLMDNQTTPELVEQIQLLHTGKRLDPNIPLSTLNLEISPVFHVLIKDKDLLVATPANHSKHPIKFIQSMSSKGKQNDPVPEFNPTHRRAATNSSSLRNRSTTLTSSKEKTDLTESNTNTSQLKDKTNSVTPNNETTTNTAQNATATTTNSTTANRARTAPITQDHKDSCCIIA